MKKFYEQFPEIEIPNILQSTEWTDSSWHNDITASSTQTFGNYDLVVWVFDDNPNQREDANTLKYTVEVFHNSCDTGMYWYTDLESDLPTLILKAKEFITKDMGKKKTIFDDEQHALSGFMWVWTNHRKGFEPGSFAEYLINAFIRADGNNFNRLASVYPAYAKAYGVVKKLEG